MSTARYIIGDSLTVLRSLPDASVDLWLTSSPFLALRSYLPPDHPDKALEVGQEATPGEFIDTLLDYAEEARRVLAPHGSMAWELGDTYAGSGGAGGDYADEGWREGQPPFDGSARRTRTDGNGKVFRGGVRQADKQGHGWPLDKSLCLIPELFRIALVYGFNPLTGRTTPRWRARNVVRWCRPNPPVGALADKVRPATSDMVVACMSRRRYFDLDAVRQVNNAGRMGEPSMRNAKAKVAPSTHLASAAGEGQWNPAGAPPLDHWWHDEDTFDQDAWLISTEPYKGSHYATWPTELCVKPIEAMCPRRVCTVCGKPSERIVAPSERYNAERCGGDFLGKQNDRTVGLQGERLNGRPNAEYLTVGWSDCGCGEGCRPPTWGLVDVPATYRDDGKLIAAARQVRRMVDPGRCADESHWRPGVVLDPFAGSGTTLAVATGHGRDAIGIDLDERNAELAARRVGMWLELERFAAGASA